MAGFVGKADGGGNFVDVLATFATGARGGEFKVGWIDDYITTDKVGNDGHRSGRGMDTASFFGGGDTLNPVSAGFVTQLVVGVDTFYFNNVFIQLGDFPADFVGVTDIHIKQIIGPKGGFLTAGAGMEFENDGAGVYISHRSLLFFSGVLGFGFLFSFTFDLFLFGGLSGGVGLAFGHFLFKFVDSTFNIGEFLSTGKERVAFGPDFHFYFFNGRAGSEGVATGTTDLTVGVVFRMDIFSHGQIIAKIRPIGKS